jgi:hypothetical protein
VSAKPTVLVFDEDTRGVLETIAAENKRQGVKSSTGRWGLSEAVRWVLRDWERLGGFSELREASTAVTTGKPSEGS